VKIAGGRSQRLKAGNASVLLPTGYTSDAILFVKAARELDCNPPMVIAQDAGYIESDFIGGVGKDADGIMSRSVFSLDLAAKKPTVAKVSAMYKAKMNKDLNDNTSRSFTGMIVRGRLGGCALPVAEMVRSQVDAEGPGGGAHG
jgi:branched-chain amino acid transport system substrate-binding protein